MPHSLDGNSADSGRHLERGHGGRNHGVVNDGGRGGRARIPGINVCGKTGTAQLASNEVLKATKVGQTMKDNAWFVGFAPMESPEIVVAALFEGGEHGQLAAPIVRDVLKAYAPLGQICVLEDYIFADQRFVTCSNLA